MPRVNIAVQTPKGPYTSISAGDLVVTMTAADASSLNSFTFSGHEVLLAQNTDSGAHTITITSSPDEHGRLGHITSYSIAAGAIVAFTFRGGSFGWRQTDGKGYISADDATVKFAVLSIV